MPDSFPIRARRCCGQKKRTIERAGARRGVAALVGAGVEDALSAFGGTRGPKPSDETLWAAIAWRIGAENFHHAVIEKIAENNADGWPRKPAAAFQRFLDKRYPKTIGDAAGRRVLRGKPKRKRLFLAQKSRGKSKFKVEAEGLIKRPFFNFNSQLQLLPKNERKHSKWVQT